MKNLRSGGGRFWIGLLALVAVGLVFWLAFPLRSAYVSASTAYSSSVVTLDHARYALSKNTAQSKNFPLVAEKADPVSFIGEVEQIAHQQGVLLFQMSVANGTPSGGGYMQTASAVFVVSSMAQELSLLNALETATPAIDVSTTLGYSGQPGGDLNVQMTRYSIYP